MQTHKIALASVTLLLGGCFLVPSPYADRLNPVAERYGAVKNGASRSELEAQLGKPSRQEEAGPAVWETRFDDLNYTTLKVWFDGQDKAQKIEITRAHGKSVPGHYTESAVSSRTK